MRKFTITSDFDSSGDQPQAIQTITENLSAGHHFQTLKGVTGSGKTFTIAKVIEKLQKPTLVISHNKTLAAQLYREFKSFFPDNAVEYFVSYYDYYQPEAYVASRDLYIEKDSSINDEIERLRLSATTSLLERHDVIVISTVSCIYGLGSPRNYRDMRIRVDKGTRLDIKTLRKGLVGLQYERNDSQLQRGVFRVRGDVIELFPSYAEEIYRIELEWDIVHRISRHHPLSFETLEELETIMIYPAKHFVMPEELLKASLGDIRDELDTWHDKFIQENKVLEAQRIKSRTEYDLEMLQEMGYCSGIENYSRHLTGRREGERPSTLIDYFPEDYLTIIDESHVTVPQIGAMYVGDRSRKQNLVEFGFRLPSALDNRPLYYAEFESLCTNTIYVSATPSKMELEKSGPPVEQLIRPTGLLDPEVEVRPTVGQIEDLLGEVKQRIAARERTLITTLTKKMAEDLSDYLSTMGLKVRYLHSEIETIERVEILTDLRMGTFDVLVGINLLREGLDLPEVSLVIILDADKIGFLRSSTSLIQTIGRAARNVNGKVIMYADRYSSAMEEAITETSRRRCIQIQYNEEHGITPRTIQKAVQNILIREKEEKQQDGKRTVEILMADHNIMIPAQRKKLIKALEAQMLEHAKKLEFEQAAIIRDEIEKLKQL